MCVVPRRSSQPHQDALNSGLEKIPMGQSHLIILWSVKYFPANHFMNGEYLENCWESIVNVCNLNTRNIDIRLQHHSCTCSQMWFMRNIKSDPGGGGVSCPYPKDKKKIIKCLEKTLNHTVKRNIFLHLRIKTKEHNTRII